MRDLARRSIRYVDGLSGTLKSQLAEAYRSKDLLAYGLRARLREGYTRKDLRADLLAALVVGFVSLPMAMALAIACDVPPEHGLYTAIVAGVICALLGGSRTQITGPTIAYVVILLPIVHKFGFAGLLVAGMMAGIILVAMGFMRLGRLMQFVPHPVTTGFTMGIAVVIVLLQLKDLFGVTLPRTEGTFAYLGSLWDARGQINGWDAAVGGITIVLLLALPVVLKKIPTAIVALVIVSIAVIVVAQLVPDFHVATIGSRFATTVGGEVVRGIPPLPPLPTVPWHGAGGVGLALDYHAIRELLPSAFAIAMLGAIESLMTATVADGMSNTRHEPNSELIALGIANVVVPFFGGIAATGALARTATNIRAGARSPLAGAFQAIVVLICTIALAPLVAYLPIAALAALLVVVARNLAEGRHFVRLLKIAPRHDVVVMLTCFVLAVVFDLVLAVTVGIVLAALLFMRRMSVLTKVDLETRASTGVELPAGVRLYDIAGPMFFGAAKTAMEAIHTVGSSKDHTFIINLEHVPTIDATGLVALESAVDRLGRSQIAVIFAGVNAEVGAIFERAGIIKVPGKLAFAPDLDTAIAMSTAKI